jgi:hypothetical protein
MTFVIDVTGGTGTLTRYSSILRCTSITNDDLLKNNRRLIIRLSQGQAQVSLDDFQTFISTLDDNSINMNDQNIQGLSRFLKEFGFQGFLMQISNGGRWPRRTDTHQVTPSSVHSLTW